VGIGEGSASVGIGESDGIGEGGIGVVGIGEGGTSSEGGFGARRCAMMW
jgi:hypothetical protein